jgi:hypothetical protein
MRFKEGEDVQNGPRSGRKISQMNYANVKKVQTSA